MHLYVLFLSGKRQEVGAEPTTTIEALIKFLLLKDKGLKDQTFYILLEKEKRIITKDEYNKTLQQLGIVKEDYLSIVLDDKPYEQIKIEDNVNAQPTTNNPPQQQQQFGNIQPSNAPFAQQNQFNNFQPQLPPQQNIVNPPQQQINQQSLQPVNVQNPIFENQIYFQPQFQNQQMPIQNNQQLNEIEELRRVNQELQAKISTLTQQLQQAEQKIKQQKNFIMQRLPDD